MCAINSAGVVSAFECEKSQTESEFADKFNLKISQIAEASILGFQFVFESFLLRKKKAQKCRQRIPVSKMTSVILLFQV
jgi:hypothetical protein